MCKAAVVLGLVLLAQTAPAPAAPTVAAHTKVVVFDAKSMHVTAQENGYCWVTSIASQRADAYRCMVANAIHDPCFELARNQVACPSDVTANTGIVVTLTKPLPAANTKPENNAWQMRLASGSLCNMGTGTTVPDYPFYCTGNVVCAAPPANEKGDAVFVRCARTEGEKLGPSGSYLVSILYV